MVNNIQQCMYVQNRIQSGSKNHIQTARVCLWDHEELELCRNSASETRSWGCNRIVAVTQIKITSGLEIFNFTKTLTEVQKRNEKVTIHANCAPLSVMYKSHRRVTKCRYRKQTDTHTFTNNLKKTYSIF